jgi:hypothetical protein
MYGELGGELGTEESALTRTMILDPQVPCPSPAPPERLAAPFSKT